MANYISPIFATGQAVDDALSKALTALQPNTTFAVNGTVGATTPTTGAFTTLSAKATQDTATLGTELVTNGAFTSDLSGWTAGTGWAYNAGVAEHTAGNTDGLTQAIAGLAVGSYYQVSFTVARTAGSVVVSLGTSAGGNVAYTTSGAKVTSFKAAGTTQDLTFTPSSDFAGSIDLVSVKLVTANATPVVAVKSSSGASILEMRPGPAASASTFVGVNAGLYVTTGVSNSAFGSNAQRVLVSGDNNCSFGANAHFNLVSGSLNSAFGVGAQFSLTAGYRNCSSGTNSFYNLTNGSFNSGVGYGAGTSLTTGSYNSLLGHAALVFATTTDNNVAIGASAGSYITNGVTPNATPSNSIYIGSDTKALADAQANQIVIGHGAVGLGANSTVVGNSSTTQAKVWGSLEITGPLKMSGYTVATLPAGSVGMRSYVTDATAPTYNATVTGGGAVKVPVFYNGTNWVTA